MPRSREDLIAWIFAHPGINARDVAEHFEIDPGQAQDLIDELLANGTLELA